MNPGNDKACAVSLQSEARTDDTHEKHLVWENIFSVGRTTAVQRAIFELRSGLPVIFTTQSMKPTAVIAAETVCVEELINVMNEPGAGLVLPSARLRHLGVDTDHPLRFATAQWTQKRFSEAVFAPTASFDELGESASTLEIAALQLLKLAQLLPAAITAPLPASIHGPLPLEIDAASVLDHHDRIADQLSIITRTNIPLQQSENAEFVLFRGSDGFKEQLAILVGELKTASVVPVRIHSACLTGDLFGSLKCDCGDQLRRAVGELKAMGGGILLYLDQEGRGIGLRNKMRAYRLQDADHDTVDADAVLGYEPDERRYRIAARMLSLLGCRKVVLLTNNPDKVKALNGYDVKVVGSKPLFGEINEHNQKYLATKASRSGHTLDEIVTSFVSRGRINKEFPR